MWFVLAASGILGTFIGVAIAAAIAAGYILANREWPEF